MSDTSGAMSAGRDSGMTRKAGPLPIWAWAVIIVGAAALVYYFVKRGSAPQSANGAGLSSTADQTAAGALSSMFGTGGNPNGFSSGFSSNQQYEQAAISELSGSTQYTPLEIQTALGNLFSGNSLSTNDQSIINTIEKSLGAPPEFTPNPTLQPASSGNYQVYYVPGNSSWALITPDNQVRMTASQSVADAWANLYTKSGNATSLTVPDWNAIYERTQTANNNATAQVVK